MGDRLDNLKDELIVAAMAGARKPSEAVGALMTAGFAILVATSGEEKAVSSLRQIVDKLAARVAN